MAINFIYPALGTVTGAELLVVADPADSNQTRNITVAQIVALSGAGCCSLQATTDAGDSTNGDIRMLAGDLTVNPGTANLAVVDIDSGDIDGTRVGFTVPSSGDFTTLTASGNAALANDLTVGNDTAITRDLGVGRNTTITGTLGVTGDTTLGANVATTGNETIGGTLGVTGLSTLATVDINGGNIDGTVVGAAVPAAIDGTTIASTSTITSGADFIAAPSFSYTAAPVGGLGNVVALECSTTPTCNVQFFGLPGIPPTETHINAADGVTLSPGTGNVTITTNLIDSPGSTNVAIDAAGSGTTVVTRDYVNNRASDWDIDMGGNDVKYENTGAFVVSDAPIVAVNPGIAMGVQGTNGFFQIPSLTTAQTSAAEGLLTVPGAMAFNYEHNAFKGFNGTNSGFLAQVFQTEDLNAVTTPLTPSNATTCVLCDNSAGSLQLQLTRIHPSLFCGQGKEYTIKANDDTSFTDYIEITPWAGNTIDGSAAPIFITEAHGSVTLKVMSPTNWAITSDFNFNTTRVYSASGTLTGAQILTLDGTMGNAITLVGAVAGAVLQPVHVNLTPLAAGNPTPYGGNHTMCIYASDLPTPNPTHEFASLMTVINHSPNYSVPITPVASLDLTEAQHTISDSIKLSNAYGSGAITHAGVAYDMLWELTYMINYV